MKIRGNTVGTTMPRADYAQKDPQKADFIKNKPAPFVVSNEKPEGSAIWFNKKENLDDTTGDAHIMAHDLNMSQHKLFGVPTPAADDEAANMGYVNAQVKKAAPRNLLDNSDWRVKNLIVNQIGQDSYTLGAWDGYTIDRWYVHEQDTNLSFVNNGIQLTGVLAQTCQSGTLIYGKQYTMAVKINGEVYCSNGTLQHTGEWHRVVEYFGENFHFQLTAADYDDYAVQIYGTDVVYEWAALYEGEYTTDTLPEYQPKGYAAELAECKRYFRILRGDPTLSGYIGSAATTVYVLYNDRMDMRKDTSIDVAVTGQVDVICNGTYYSANVLSAICDQAQFALNVQYIADTPPIKMPCMVYAYGNIQLSANL